MDPLKDVRKKISTIDIKIIALLAKRKNLVSKVGRIKKKHSISITDKLRESTILKKYSSLAKKKGLDSKLVQKIFKSLISYSKSIEKKI